jgi:hypothetical protein
MAWVLGIVRVFVPVNVPGYLKTRLLFMGCALSGAHRTDQQFTDARPAKICWEFELCLRIYYHGEFFCPRRRHPKLHFKLLEAKWPQVLVKNVMLHHLVQNRLLLFQETCVLLASV